MILAHDANESLIEKACIEDATRRRWRYANWQVSFSTIEHGDRIITIREVTDLQSYARRLVPKYRGQARKDEEGRMIRQAHGQRDCLGRWIELMCEFQGSLNLTKGVGDRFGKVEGTRRRL